MIEETTYTVLMESVRTAGSHTTKTGTHGRRISLTDMELVSAIIARGAVMSFLQCIESAQSAEGQGLTRPKRTDNIATSAAKAVSDYDTAAKVLLVKEDKTR